MSLPLALAAALAPASPVAGVVVDVATVQAPGPVAPRVPAIEVVLEDPAGERFAFRLPGDNGGDVQVAGVPVVEPGSRWVVDLVPAGDGWAVRGLGAGLTPLGDPARYVLNQVQYLPDQLPLGFYLEESGAEDLGFDATEALVEESMEEWNAVRCADFAFGYLGPAYADELTGLDNLLSWTESDWPYDPLIAGFAATRFGDRSDGSFGAIGADIEFNGTHWRWVDGVGDAYATPASVGAASIITHELGHVTGLGHEPDVLAATMYGGYFGGDHLRSLAGDDRAGLCANYPTGDDECEVDGDCAWLGEGRLCVPVEGRFVCDERRDPLGEPCARTDINCADTCAFTSADATEGYCTWRCPDGLCPTGWVCDDFDGIQIPLEGGPVCQPDPDYVPPGDDDDSVEEPTGCGGGAALLLLAPLAVRRRD